MDMPALGRLLACAALLSAPVPVLGQDRGFDVPAQPASRGVRELARQAGIQIIVAGEQSRGLSTSRVKGVMSIRAALDRLLDGTGLQVLTFDGKIAVLGRRTAEIPQPPPERIIVTGTRIARPELHSPMPVSVVDMRDAADAGVNSLHDAISRDPAVAAGIGLNTSFNQPWDAGVASISLRNLGTNRSLTLVDGMRRVSGSARSSAVDMNMIPPAMIDRIEIITGGATAIYGADAVTGAVNIVTRFDLEGAEYSASGGISGHGDAAEHSLSFALGGDLGGGRGIIGATYSSVESLGFSQRYDTYIRNTPNPRDTGLADGIPDQITATDFRQIYYAYQPSFFHDGQSYLVEDGRPRPAGYDVTFWPGEFSFGNGGDGRNLRDADQLRGGLDAIALMAKAEYPLSDTLTYDGYIEYGRSFYDGTAASPFHRDDSRPTFFGGAGGSVALPDNPFLPAGVREFMIENGLEKLNISRTYGNFPMMRELHDRATVTVGQSLGGPLGGELEGKVFFQYGRASDDVRTTNIPRTSHWLAARDAVADTATGDPVCRSPQARADGCLPIDIFSQAPPSQGVLSYALDTRDEQRRNTQTIAGVNISGTAVRLPYGPVSIAAGAEYRHETLRTRDDPLAESELVYGGSAYVVHPALDASHSVAEAYVEMMAPLLEGVRFAENLELEAAYRRSEYGNAGGFDTWKIGGYWSPVPGISLRGVRSRSVRRPNFGELYEPAVGKQSGSITDPCEAGDYYQSATRAANCRALGISVPLEDFKIGPLVTTRGNPALRPETSNSFTLGMVLGSPLVPGLKATVDYWDIAIDDVITQYDYTTVLNLCVDLPTIENVFCDAVSRNPADGSVTAISIGQINASKMLARGLDFAGQYTLPAGGGKIDLSLKATYLFHKSVESSLGVAAGRVRYHGDWQNPRIQGTLQARYDAPPFAAGLTLRVIGASEYDVNAASPEVYEDNTVPPVIYPDVFASRQIGEQAKIIFGIRNMLNTRPPEMFTIYKDGSIYDNVGRYVYFTVSGKL